MGRLGPWWSWLVVLGCFSCGGGGDGGEISPYAGAFTILESWKEDLIDTQCSPPPTAILENTIEVTIKKSQFRADFEVRWGTFLGEFHADQTFLSVDNQNLSDESLEFSGQFQSPDGLIGVLKHIRPGCTRVFDVEGERRP